MGFVKRKNKTPLFQFSAPPPHSSPRVLQVILELLPPAPFYYLSLLFNSTLLVSPVTRVHASMDNTMEIDTARSPEPHHLSPITDPGSIPTLDGWIESLMTCKQLAEDDVRRLCDRVGFLFFFFSFLFLVLFGLEALVHVDICIDQLWVLPCCRQERCCRKSRTSSRWYVSFIVTPLVWFCLGQWLTAIEMSRHGLR